MVKLNNQAVHNIKQEVTHLSTVITEEKEKYENHLKQYETYKQEAAEGQMESLRVLNSSIQA